MYFEDLKVGMTVEISPAVTNHRIGATDLGGNGQIYEKIPGVQRSLAIMGRGQTRYRIAIVDQFLLHLTGEQIPHHKLEGGTHHQQRRQHHNRGQKEGADKR